MIYVMSDIHGHMNRFRSVMDQIQLREDDHLYVLGDCIDRFPDGLEILKELYSMPNVTVLLGNHEYMMLKALEKPLKSKEPLHLWYGNGGKVTHDEWKLYTKAQQDEVIEIIRSLPVNVEVRCNGTDYLLVHGAPLGYKQKTDDPVLDSVWTRLGRYSYLNRKEIVVFGHTPTYHHQHELPMRVYHGCGMIGIDCACYDETIGRLACLRLDDMAEFYSVDPAGEETDEDELE